ncbi:MAG: insulinase family protein [Candidatus Omnitrophica bacterium]|nr:insulinase family protein [Candidatus Omnitrophota bacterium]
MNFNVDINRTKVGGIDVITSPMTHMSSVTLGVWIKVGGRNETAKTSGISHLIEHMLFKGSLTRSAKDLKESIEGVGGLFNAFTSDETTCYMVKVPSKYTDRALEILADMVTNPKFDPIELEKEKFVVCEEINMYKDQPAEKVLENLAQMMWPDDPLGRPLTGTIENVKAFTRKDLRNFKNKYYVPENMSVIASGNIEQNKFVEKVGEIFEKKKSNNVFSYKTPRIKQKNECFSVETGNTNQAHMAMGFRTIANDTNGRVINSLLNVILGGNMSSRLFEELREKNGLCYDIGSSYKRHKDVGEFVVHAGVDNNKAAFSNEAILKELKKLKTENVSDEELTRAKEYSKGQFLLALESTSARMMWLGDNYITDGKIPDVNNILKKVDNVTSENVRKTSCDLFLPENLNLSIIGKINAKDKAHIKKMIKQL